MINRILMMLSILVITFLVNAAPPDYDLVREAGDIKGNITICGQSEPNVLVYTPGTSFSAFTDGGGNFRLSYVQEGTYDLVVKHLGIPVGTISQVAVVKKQTVDIGSSNHCIDLDNDGYSPPQDCNDSNPAINPGQTDVCGDGLDNNCDGSIDGGCYICTDNDSDLFFAQSGCGTPLDCNDTDASINPQAMESCDGVDNNCNGQVDESGTNQTSFYLDTDMDTYGDDNTVVLACAPPQGYVSQPGDCDDTDATINPAAQEVCNGIDDNCSAGIDEGLASTLVPNGSLQCSGGTSTITCDAGFLDANGIPEDGCELQVVTCDPDGLYTLAPTVTYTCALGLFNMNVSNFTFSADGANIQPGPVSNANQLTGAPTSCPVGNFNNTEVISGDCNESYELTGSFTGQDTWTGVYSITFTGSCFDCATQTFNVTGTR